MRKVKSKEGKGTTLLYNIGLYCYIPLKLKNSITKSLHKLAYTIAARTAKDSRAAYGR